MSRIRAKLRWCSLNKRSISRKWLLNGYRPFMGARDQKLRRPRCLRNTDSISWTECLHVDMVGSLLSCRSTERRPLTSCPMVGGSGLATYSGLRRGVSCRWGSPAGLRVWLLMPQHTTPTSGDHTCLNRHGAMGPTCLPRWHLGAPASSRR